MVKYSKEEFFVFLLQEIKLYLIIPIIKLFF